jgi:ABC-type branched-subunit amino acid transport system permease subunit
VACADQCGQLLAQLLIYGLTDGAVVALNAAGFTLAYSVARQINLAHGSVFALTTVVVANITAFAGVTAATPLGFRIVALIGLAVCGAVCGGLLNVGVERLAFRPFRGVRDPLAPLVASVALSFVLFQAGVWWHDLRFVAPVDAHQGVNLPLLAMPDLVPKVELGWGGVSFTLKDLLVLLIAGLVAGGGSVLLARTKTGRLLRAVAQDPETTALMGGDPARAQTIAFAVGGAVAGFGAAIFAAYFGGANAQYGLRSGLAAMTAAVLGGVGDPRGALLGGMLLGVFASFSDYLLDAEWTPVLVLVLLIGLLAFRPNGLLGSSTSGTDSGPPARPVLAASRGTQRRSAWVLGGLLVLGVAYPWLDQAAGWFRLPGATMALLMVTLAVGLTVVVGFAGLLDLGYAAFFAIGSYTAALLTSQGGRLAELVPTFVHNPWLALPLAGMVAAAFGVLFGLPSVRTRGEYLAIVTLAFGEIVPLVIWHLPDWTGGPRGVSGIPPVSLGLLPIGAGLGSYLVALGLAALACLAALRLGSSRVGRAWAAVREDELAAASLGINPPLLKLLAFALGAGFAGVAGAGFAQLFGYVEPGQFDFTVSLMVLAAVVIGGRWGVPGAVFGALGIAFYDRFLVEGITAGLHAVGVALNSVPLQTVDLRQHNFAVFGVALFLATLFRARRGEEEPERFSRSPDTPSAPARFAAGPGRHLQGRSGPSPARSRGAPRSGP